MAADPSLSSPDSDQCPKNELAETGQSGAKWHCGSVRRLLDQASGCGLRSKKGVNDRCFGGGMPPGAYLGAASTPDDRFAEFGVAQHAPDFLSRDFSSRLACSMRVFSTRRWTSSMLASPSRRHINASRTALEGRRPVVRFSSTQMITAQ